MLFRSAGVGGRVHQGSPLEAATDVAMFTRAGVERIMRFAFRLARSRPRKLLTVVTKSNAQRHAMVMWDEIATEVAARHAIAHPSRPDQRMHRKLELGGEYQWRREGEHHLFNPETVYRLQHATRAGRYDVFKQYTKAVDDQSRELATLRGLFRLKTGVRPAIPVEDVEPVSEIVKRFSTGAMSYGSISAEAHEKIGRAHV